MTPQNQRQEQSTQSKSRGLGAVVLHHTVTAFMLALMIAIGVWSYLTFRETSFFQPPDESATSRVTYFTAVAQQERIKSALQVHFRLHDEYPASLDVLVERGLLLESDLYYPASKFEYEYERVGDSFTLKLVS
jgi:hypothetical protein